MMVNNTIKIDMNADTYHHVLTYGLDLSRLEHILFTHSHTDHFTPAELEYLRHPFAHRRTKEKVDIWGSKDVIRLIRETFPDADNLQAVLHTVEPFAKIDLQGLAATPIIAVHKEGEECLNWVLGSLDNGVLYASDTGWYQEPTWNFLSGVRLDMVISECTLGNLSRSPTHMSVDTVRQMRDRLDKMGSLKPECRFVITHFSHNAMLLHEQLEELVREDGFIVAYDGISLDGGS